MVVIELHIEHEREQQVRQSELARDVVPLVVAVLHDCQSEGPGPEDM